MSFLRLLLRDRFVWFVLIGLALFVGEWALQKRQDKVIYIDLPLVEKLATQWQAQTKSAPAPHQLDALIEGYIREEILVREAERLGLDDQDVIIRRRLAQKVEFFLGDAAAPEPPTEADLRAFFESQKQRYSTPETVSFRHIFTASQADAQALLATANDENWRNLGQPFMLNREYARLSQTDLLQLMGSQFSDALFADGPTGQWRGPVRSAFGWHVVNITSRSAASPAPFETMVEKLANDWHADKAAQAKQKAWQDIRASYRIEMAPIEDAPQ